MFFKHINMIYFNVIREFVISQLGETFVQQENLDVGKAYAETSAATPLIFILGEEVDPCKYIFR